MSARSIILTIVLICLAAMLLIGRMRRWNHVHHVRHHRTSDRWGGPMGPGAMFPERLRPPGVPTSAGLDPDHRWRASVDT